MNTQEKITALRKLMASEGIDAYIIPSNDPHMGEYIPAHWQARQWISGFTGSAGTVVVTRDYAGLWTDSRYFLQAEDQLKGSGIELQKLKIPHTPEHIEWIAHTLNVGNTVGIDGKLLSPAMKRLMEKSFSVKEIRLCLKHDFIGQLWNDRPALPDCPVFIHDVEYTGKSTREKLAELRLGMTATGVSHHLFATLDDIAWLFNIRSADVDFSPLAVSYALVSMTDACLFINPAKITAEVRTALESEGVNLYPYKQISDALAKLSKDDKVMLDPSNVNMWLMESIPQNTKIVEGAALTSLMKAVKNTTELANIHQTMINDGIAMVKFLIWLEENVGQEKITEISASEKLHEFRSMQPGFMGESFGTIAGYKEHGAIVHYEATPETDAELHPEGLFLLDSGGQYLGGTTDITRVIALGDPSPQEKRDFTLALKGTIALSMAVFPEGTKGYQLEAFARMPLWKCGLNYGHGTGHGVGFFLNVHEGPQSIGSSASGAAAIPLQPGMITSIEPGLYLEDRYGIRTENMVEVVEKNTSVYGRFYTFEPLSLCPIDRKLIDVSLLTIEEKTWLNDYHVKVFWKLSQKLTVEETTWLQARTYRIR